MSNKELWEGFVSAAQRKAVWASKADGGKGHPDNKKKKSKKEDVNEISKGMAGRYLKKVPASSADAGRKAAGTTGIGPEDQKKNTKKGISQFVNRNKGTSMAVDKMTGKAKVPATESVNNEGYSSYAQQKAVWASRADKKKGKNEARVECPKCDGKGCDHCDNKGYHIESVEVSEKHVYRFSTKTKQGNIHHSSKDDAGAKKAIEKKTGEKVQSMTYRGPVSGMPTRREDSDAVKAFLAKGGKIKKLPPAKAQGYHGKDDPGKDVKGVMDKPDTDKFKTKKKVKSMESKTFFDLRSQLLERSKGDV